MTHLNLQGHDSPNAVVISDLSVCTPRDALGDAAAPDRWQLVPYTAEGGLIGTMLAAEGMVDPPDVTVPLDVAGWHAISIGYWRGIYYDMTFKWRLSTEAIFTKVHAPFNDMPWDRTELVETFPVHADLTGVDGIVLCKPRAMPVRKACIAYVKLTPLTDAEVDEIARDRARTDTRRIIATNDCEGTFRIYSPRTREELLEDVEPYRHADVGKVFWGVNIGDLTYYKSDVGRFYMDGPVCPLTELQHAADGFQALHDQGIEPYKAVMEHVQDMGREFYTYFRMAMIDHQHPYNIFAAESVFLPEHPDCRIVAKDGTPIMKASYACEATHGFMLGMMEETMREGVDGVALCFVRGPEYFGYEQPVIDEFMRLHGKDPRELPDQDPRLQAVWAGFMTAFIRKVHAAAEKHGKALGRKIRVATWLDCSDERMARFGYDARTWITEGLVDCVIGLGPQDMFALAREHSCEVYAFGSGEGTILDVAEMKGVYAADLDGMVYWDLDSVQELPESWLFVRRLGHREEVLDLPPGQQMYPKQKRTKLLTLAGRDVHHLDHSIPLGAPCAAMLPWFSGG